MKTEKHLRQYAEEDKMKAPNSTILKTRIKIHLAEKFKTICRSNDWSESQGIRAGIMKLIDDCGQEGKKKYGND